MKKIIYFWIDKVNKLDDFDVRKGFLFEEFGINLSSEFNVTSEKKKNSVNIKIVRTPSFKKNFYSTRINDIKVIVGNNGTGKSTILTQLFSVLTKNNPPQNDYFLIYTEGKKFYCIKKEHLSVSIDTLPNGFSFEHAEEDSFVKELPIIYCPEFKANTSLPHPDYRDLSTDSFFIRDKETVLNTKSSLYNSYKHEDRLVYFHEMEENRLIDFLINAGNEFFSIFPIPQMMTMSIAQENIECGATELASYLLKRFNTPSSLADIIPESDFDILTENQQRYANKFFSEEDKHDLIGSIKEIIIKIYNAKPDINTKILFATYLSAVRSFNDLKHDDSLEISLRALKQNTLEELSNFFQKNKSEEIRLLGKRAQNIVDICKKNTTKEQTIIFNLQKKDETLRQVRDIHNVMYKLSPVFNFSFTRPISSGEREFLKLFSRLYACIREYSKKSKKFGTIYLMIDECDIFMHPEWQRRWIDSFVNIVQYLDTRLKKIRLEVANSDERTILTNRKHLNIQLILTTHSPFFLTDFFDSNIVSIKREEKDNIPQGKAYCSNEPINSFAGNIYDILGSGFFLKSSMGVYVNKKLMEIQKKPQKYQFEISAIGDPILKAIFMDKLKNRS